MAKNGNEMSSSFNEITIEVYENMPVILDLSVSSEQGLHKISDNEYMLLEKSELVFNCNHNGTQITWSLPNNKEEKGVNPLVISNIDKSNNQGDYICTVSNSMDKPVQYKVSVIIVQSSRIKEPEETEIELEPTNSLLLISSL